MSLSARVRTYAFVGSTLVLAAACSASKPSASGRPSVPTTAPAITLSATPTASAATASTPAPTTTAAAPPTTSSLLNGRPPCTTDKMKITFGQGDAGLGHEGVAITFRNVGPTECRISGYPGVDAIDRSGHEVAHARRTKSGYLGGQRNSGPPAVIYLVPKELASALVEGGSVPQGPPSRSGSSCGSYFALLVTPPGETHSVAVATSLPACSGLQVHPVVPGPSGSS